MGAFVGRGDFQAQANQDQDAVEGVPGRLEEILWAQAEHFQQQFQAEDPREYVVQDIEDPESGVQGQAAVDEGQDNNDGSHDGEWSALDDGLEAEGGVDESSESDPQLPIVEAGRHHGGIGLEDLAQLHELTDLNLAIVGVVQLQADLSDVVDVPDFVLVNREKEADHFLLGNIQVFLA